MRCEGEDEEKTTQNYVYFYWEGILIKKLLKRGVDDMIRFELLMP
jgi:hypothetical protein